MAFFDDEKPVNFEQYFNYWARRLRIYGLMYIVYMMDWLMIRDSDPNLITFLHFIFFLCIDPIFFPYIIQLTRYLFLTKFHKKATATESQNEPRVLWSQGDGGDYSENIERKRLTIDVFIRKTLIIFGLRVTQHSFCDGIHNTVWKK